VRLPTQDSTSVVAQDLMGAGLKVAFSKSDETDAYRNYITKASHRKYTVVVAAHPVSGKLFA
jgi:hypothetical protein